MSDEFYSFDEALDELRLKEEELKRLVSEGEIRAFRKGDTMKLRKSDVENLRAELTSGEVVDLGEATEELVFEDDGDLDDDAGMATQEISDVDTLIEDDIEDVGELELEDDDDDDEIVTAAPVRRAGAASRASEEDEDLSPIAVGAVLLTVGLLFAFVSVAMSLSTGNVSGVADVVGGIFAADKFAK